MCWSLLRLKGLIALFRCLRSRQMLKLSSDLSNNLIEFTQSMGSPTLRITPHFSVSSNSTFTLSRNVAGIVQGGFTKGVPFGSISM